METVSLIDEKKPRPKRTEGDAAAKRSFLPPISRIHAPPEPSPRQSPVAPASRNCRHAPVTEARRLEPAAASTEAEAEPQKIIHIKPPIIVKELALATRPEEFPAHQRADG